MIDRMNQPPVHTCAVYREEPSIRRSAQCGPRFRQHGAAGDLCQAGVQNLDLTPLREDDACGLDIAVYDASFMRTRMALSNLNRHVQRFLRTDPLTRTPSFDSVLQGFPFVVLHNNKRLPLMLTDFVDRTDIGVFQG